MIKSRIIVNGATGKTGSVVVAKPLNAAYPVRTIVCREDGRSAQLKELKRIQQELTDYDQIVNAVEKQSAPNRNFSDPL